MSLDDIEDWCAKQYDVMVATRGKLNKAPPASSAEPVDREGTEDPQISDTSPFSKAVTSMQPYLGQMEAGGVVLGGLTLGALHGVGQLVPQGLRVGA